MRNNLVDSTYRGFITVYDSKNNILEFKGSVNCSQIIWQASEKYDYKVDHIRFYYPNDYLIPIARNKIFLEEWVETIRKWFEVDIKYLGKFESGEISYNNKAINENNCYTYESDKLTRDSYLLNRGDLIINDIWRGFEIKIPKYNIGKKSMLEYAGFCMIRYLFYSTFHPLVLDFLYARKNKTRLDIDTEDFTIFQLVHYNSSCVTGYSGFYGFMRDLTKNSFLNKLVSLVDFKRLLNEGTILNTAFNSSTTTNITYKEAKELLNTGKIKELYERLK